MVHSCPDGSVSLARVVPHSVVSGRKTSFPPSSIRRLKSSGTSSSEAQELETEFVIQWTSRDLDRLAKLWSGSNLDPSVEPMNNLANDCGIFDENGRRRLSYNIWQNWLRRPIH